MVQLIQAQNATFRDLEENFNLEYTEDEQFFPEWRADFPDLSDFEKQQLDKVKAGYLNLLKYPPVLESTVKMVVLDPILFIGNFYLSPFQVRAEEPVELVTEDEGSVIKGRIDTLVLKQQLWITIIESKRLTYSIEAGTAQILAYMLGSASRDRPSYGLITNGGTWMFLKAVKDNISRYAISDAFLTQKSGHLYGVLKFLKHLATSD